MGTPTEVPDEADKMPREAEAVKVRDIQSTGEPDTPPIHHLRCAGLTGFMVETRNGVRTHMLVLGRISPNHHLNESLTSSELQK